MGLSPVSHYGQQGSKSVPGRMQTESTNTPSFAFLESVRTVVGSLFHSGQVLRAGKGARVGQGVWGPDPGSGAYSHACRGGRVVMNIT